MRPENYFTSLFVTIQEHGLQRPEGIVPIALASLSLSIFIVEGSRKIVKFLWTKPILYVKSHELRVKRKGTRITFDKFKNKESN